MKQYLLSAIRLTLAFALLFMCLYPLCLWGIAQMAPNHGKGAILKQGDRYFYENIGQAFTQDRYFYSRPSAANYNAAGSAGSNKGPSNPDYLAEVATRIDSFLAHNPGVQKSDIPSELVCASGSGLDPHISIQGARIQVPRIAKTRQLDARDLNLLIEQRTEKALLGLFGTERINVLKLNLALDSLSANHQQ